MVLPKPATAARGVRAILVAIAAVSLAGCVPALIGGAAAGGYYVGKDERPASQIAEDATVTAAVKTKLIADPDIKAFDINVSTYENVVILEGRVAKSAQRAKAERIARDTRGVKGVRNELRVRSR